MIEDVDYTASGYIQAIAPDGTVISRHRQEREAQQACFQHAKDNEDLLGDGVHDYILRSPDVRMSIRLLSVGGNPTNEDTTPPDPPAGVFNNSVTSSGFTTNWTSGPESDLQEHNVYRSSTGPSSGFSLIDTVTVPTASYSHTGLAAETQYWVYVTALDSSGNESVASSVVSSTTSAASSEPYDLTLGGSRTIPFSYSWPTVPSTSSTINVTANDGAGLLSAIRTAGATVNVPAGTYSTSLTGFADDVDVVADNGATVSLTGSFDLGNSNRVRWTGGVINGNNAQSFYQAGGSDHMFSNVRFDAMQSMLPGFATATRVAFVNCTIDSEEYGGFFSQTDLHNDIIYAACDLYGGNGGGQSNIRFMGVTTGILVDSRLRDDTHHTFRVHYASDYIYAANNQFETGNGILLANHPIGGGVLQCNRFWFVDNKVYAGWTAFSGYYPSGTDGITVLTMTGNENYASAPSFPVFLDGASTGPGWDVSGNTTGLTGSPAAMPNAGADH